MLIFTNSHAEFPCRGESWKNGPQLSNGGGVRAAWADLSRPCLQKEGLKEGDYIVAVKNIDCKWLGVGEVVRLLKDVDEEGVDLQVVSMMDSGLPMVSPASRSLTWHIPPYESTLCFPHIC